MTKRIVASDSVNGVTRVHFDIEPSDVESAIRQFICDCNPEMKEGWVVNPILDGDLKTFVANKP